MSAPNEIARIEQGTGLLPAAGYANDALRELAEWVQAARSVTELVAPLVDTPFVPEHYRPKISDRATPEERGAARAVAIATATAAVLQGTKLGFDPLTALQQIYIVHGRPGMYARAKVALLLSKGHEVWTEDLTDHRAVVSGRRRGETTVQTVTVTMEMARKAGWTTNPSKAYDKTPQDMLYARAASRVCDRVAPEVLLGIESVEEIQDSIQADAGVGSRTVRPPARRALETAAEADRAEVPAIKAEARPGDFGPGLETMPPIEEKQWRDMTFEFRRLGGRYIGEGQQAARLARINEIVERAEPIVKGSELTYDEAALVLAELRAETPAQPAQPAPAQPAAPAVAPGHHGGDGDADGLLEPPGPAWPATAPVPAGDPDDLLGEVTQ